PNVRYDIKQSERSYNLNSTNMIFIKKLIPYVPTEITVYNDWNAPNNSVVDFTISGIHEDINFEKHLYEISEPIKLTIGRYYNKQGTEMTETGLSNDPCFTNF